LCHLRFLGAESLGFQLRRSRGQQSPFLKGGCLRSRQRDSDGPCGPAPSTSLTPLGSSLWEREPAVESFAIFRCRVIRIPSAAEPRSTVPLFQRGMSAKQTEGFRWVLFTWRFKCSLCSKPVTISQPRGQLSSGKRAYVCVICDFWVQSL
jgi:hypothetical protein